MVQARDKRIPIMFSEQELIEIDEWRHNNRIATRADAVRRLCKIGMLASLELGPIVDNVSNGISVLSEQKDELLKVQRQVLNPSTLEAKFGYHEIWDVFALADAHGDTALTGLSNVAATLITLYETIIAVMTARSVKAGITEAEKIIERANAEYDEAEERRKQRELEAEENRYLSIMTGHTTPEEDAAYEAMSDDEQEEELGRRIAVMKDLEERNPKEFRERYGIDNRYFWDTEEWTDFLKSSSSPHKGEASD